MTRICRVALTLAFFWVAPADAAFVAFENDRSGWLEAIRAKEFDESFEGFEEDTEIAPGPVALSGGMSIKAGESGYPDYNYINATEDLAEVRVTSVFDAEIRFDPPVEAWGAAIRAIFPETSIRVFDAAGQEIGSLQVADPFQFNGFYGFVIDGGEPAARIVLSNPNFDQFLVDEMALVRDLDAVSREWIGGPGGHIYRTDLRNDAVPDEWLGQVTSLVDVSVVGEAVWMVAQNRVLHSADAGETWDIQLRLDDSTRAEHVEFVDDQLGWVGALTSLLRSADGGRTWETKRYTSFLVSDMDAFGPDRVWAVGIDGVLRSQDGGESWLQDSTTTGLLAVHFLDENNGWGAGLGGMLLRTNNGGASWIDVPSGTAENLGSIFFVNSDDGWVVGNNGVALRTSDGGATWDPLDTGVGSDLHAVSFANALDGVIARELGVLRTDDGGDTWQVIAIDASPRQIFSAVLQGDGSGWAVGGSTFAVSDFSARADRAAAFRTADYGASWVPENLGPRGAVTSIAAVDTARAFAVGQYENTFPDASSEIVRTLDGGASWESVYELPSNHGGFLGISFSDPQSGWAVGYDALVLRTVDGGESWGDRSFPNSFDLIGVKALGPDEAIAVGSGGIIIQTLNGGSAWAIRATGVTSDLYSVDVAEGQAWSVGTDGTILHSADGGETWQSQDSQVGVDLFGVDFVDASVGWAVGEGGTVLKTIDGGASWVLQLSDTLEALQGVAALDASRARVVGWGPTLLATDDGGASWKPRSTSFMQGTTPLAITLVPEPSAIACLLGSLAGVGLTHSWRARRSAPAARRAVHRPARDVPWRSR